MGRRGPIARVFRPCPSRGAAWAVAGAGRSRLQWQKRKVFHIYPNNIGLEVMDSWYGAYWNECHEVRRGRPGWPPPVCPESDSNSFFDFLSINRHTDFVLNLFHEFGTRILRRLTVWFCLCVILFLDSSLNISAVLAQVLHGLTSDFNSIDTTTDRRTLRSNSGWMSFWNYLLYLTCAEHNTCWTCAEHKFSLQKFKLLQAVVAAVPVPQRISYAMHGFNKSSNKYFG